MSTLIDPFEVVRPASPPVPARVTFRARLPTLVDPFELRAAESVDDVDGDAGWETVEREPCRVIVEHSPRGARSETWRRARCWGAEEPIRRRAR